MSIFINVLISVTTLAILLGVPTAVVLFVISIFIKENTLKSRIRKWSLLSAVIPVALFTMLSIVRAFLDL